ncbi:hypothetical protein [Methanobrevibacter sp.]|uniref:hypothetical protein n=1 Tax=Methanobrevibacter sp. TaxID=66852 RepID=UPI0026DFB241|nr:hypothetical protein [Methanobrevibacter sp.]
MDILTTVVYIILFIIIMIFVFSIGMLKPFMRKKETALVLVSAFIIGCLGGAFFLSPIYDDVPEVMSTVQKVIPNNDNETMYLDVSSSVDLDALKNNLTHIDGVHSFEVTGITFYMWQFTDKEMTYMNAVLENIDANYKNFTVNESGKIDIDLVPGYEVNSALKSFSDWYKNVYAGTISYAQVHIKVVLAPSAIDQSREYLLEEGIVPTKMEGPVQDSINKTNSTMLNNGEFVLISGGIGVIVALLGIYVDKVVVVFRKFKKSKKSGRRRR